MSEPIRDLGDRATSDRLFAVLSLSYELERIAETCLQAGGDELRAMQRAVQQMREWRVGFDEVVQGFAAELDGIAKLQTLGELSDTDATS